MSFKMPSYDLKMFQNLCDTFYLEREGEIINESVKGFFCSNDHPSSIQVLGNYDIKEEDYLIHGSSKKRCFIDDVKPITDEDFILHYQSEYQRKNARSREANIHIENLNGPAIVGNQQNATINMGVSFDEIRNFIAESKDINLQEKETLNKLTNTVEAIINNDMQISGGIFSKFSNLAEKHSSIIAAIMQPLINWLLGTGK